MLRALANEIERRHAFPNESPVHAARHAGEGVEMECEGQVIEAALIAESPRLVKLGNLVRADEPATIMKLAKPLLSASRTGADVKAYGATVRTSSSAVILEVNQVRTPISQRADCARSPPELLLLLCPSQHDAVKAVRHRIANLPKPTWSCSSCAISQGSSTSRTTIFSMPAMCVRYFEAKSEGSPSSCT